MFAGEVFAAELQRMDQYAGRGNRRRLCGRMRRVELVPLQEGSVFSSSRCRNVGRNSRKSKKDFILEFHGNGIRDVFPNQRSQPVEARRSADSLRLPQNRSSFRTGTKKENTIDLLVTGFRNKVRGAEAIACIVTRDHVTPRLLLCLFFNGRSDAAIELEVGCND